MEIAVNDNGEHGVEQRRTLIVQTVLPPEHLRVAHDQPRVLGGADEDVGEEVESRLFDSGVGSALPLQDQNDASQKIQNVDPEVDIDPQDAEVGEGGRIDPGDCGVTIRKDHTGENAGEDHFDEPSQHQSFDLLIPRFVADPVVLVVVKRSQRRSRLHADLRALLAQVNL